MKALKELWGWFVNDVPHVQGPPPQGGSCGKPKPKLIVRIPCMDMNLLGTFSASTFDYWQERVIKEKADLDAKLNRLSAFGLSESFDELSAEDQGLLGLQHAAMEEYSRVLGRRIDRFQKRKQ